MQQVEINRLHKCYVLHAADMLQIQFGYGSNSPLFGLDGQQMVGITEWMVWYGFPQLDDRRCW
jgi:hypothetical protein